VRLRGTSPHIRKKGNYVVSSLNPLHKLA